MKWTTPRNVLLAASLAATCLACVGPLPRQADVPVSATGPEPLPGTLTDGEAERLVIGAASCWMGGLWSDALGEPAGDARAAAIEHRCDAVLVHVYGAVDPMQYRQLRAAEVRVVADLSARVHSVASSDRVDRARADSLVRLLGAIADAQRENILARGPADDVKKDEAGVSDYAERAHDKTFAAEALRQTAGIEALLSLDVGDLSHEARAIGLLCALDRVEIARRLPKHLKVYAVGGPFVPIFGVKPPPMSDDPTVPIPTGTWPGYLIDVASASGHPVPATATDPLDRESLAWGGVLQAFADQLRSEGASVSTRTPLPRVLAHVADRLDRENSTLRSLFKAEQRAQK